MNFPVFCSGESSVEREDQPIISPLVKLAEVRMRRGRGGCLIIMGSFLYSSNYLPQVSAIITLDKHITITSRNNSIRTSCNVPRLNALLSNNIHEILLINYNKFERLSSYANNSFMVSGPIPQNNVGL